jgi:hypothetical protein
MNGLNSFSTTKPYSKKHHEPSILQRMERSDIVLFVSSDGVIEIGKNRYGVIGKLNSREGIETLINLLTKAVFNNTCIIFQESLKRIIYKEIGGYKILEGEENDKIRRAIFSDGAHM